jgi:hypothetical protein
MKITVESTTKITELNGIPARVWVGETDSGIKIHCFITRVAVNVDEPRANELAIELQEQKAPSAEIEAIPGRLIL